MVGDGRLCQKILEGGEFREEFLGDVSLLSEEIVVLRELVNRRFGNVDLVYRINIHKLGSETKVLILRVFFWLLFKRYLFGQ